MEDEAILLKIKRQFSKDESIHALLKIISEVRIENGILKSELSEAKTENNKIKNSVKQHGTKLKKEWLRDEVFAELKKNIAKKSENEKRLQRQVNEWREKYFNLINKK